MIIVYHLNIINMIIVYKYIDDQVLNDMQKLERHPIIKIINEFKRKEEEEYNY